MKLTTYVGSRFSFITRYRAAKIFLMVDPGYNLPSALLASITKAAKTLSVTEHGYGFSSKLVGNGSTEAWLFLASIHLVNMPTAQRLLDFVLFGTNGLQKSASSLLVVGFGNLLSCLRAVLGRVGVI